MDVYDISEMLPSPHYLFKDENYIYLVPPQSSKGFQRLSKSLRMHSAAIVVSLADNKVVKSRYFDATMKQKGRA